MLAEAVRIKPFVCAPNPSWDPTLWNGGIPFVSEWHVSQEIISVGHEGTNRDDASYCRLDFFGSAGLCSMRGGAAAGTPAARSSPFRAKGYRCEKAARTPKKKTSRIRRLGRASWKKKREPSTDRIFEVLPNYGYAVVRLSSLLARADARCSRGCMQLGHSGENPA